MTTATGKSTLVLRLDGPMQAWGGPGADWDHRPTGLRPTKTAVIGMLAAAMGIGRGHDLGGLDQLLFSCRADRPGTEEFDFRTAGGGQFPLDSLTANTNPTLTRATNLDGQKVNYGAPRGSKNNTWAEGGRTPVMRLATYLADAAFLVALTGPAGLLRQAADALERPVFPVYLGRRACPPAHPLVHTILDGDHHADWAGLVPLLDNATDPTPDTVTETPGTGTVSYEQPHPQLVPGQALATTITTINPTPPRSTQ